MDGTETLEKRECLLATFDQLFLAANPLRKYPQLGDWNIYDFIPPL